MCFSPSICEDLLKEALEFASLYDNITEEEKNIVQAKQSLLYFSTEIQHGLRENQARFST